MDDFVTKESLRAQLDQKAKQELRAAHFEYGTSSPSETVGIQSTSHSAFNGMPGKKAELPAATMTDLRCVAASEGVVDRVSMTFVRFVQVFPLPTRLRAGHGAVHEDHSAAVGWP